MMRNAFYQYPRLALVLALVLLCAFPGLCTTVYAQTDAPDPGHDFSSYIQSFTSDGQPDTKDINGTMAHIRGELDATTIVNRLVQALKETFLSGMGYFSGLFVTVVLCGVACIAKQYMTGSTGLLVENIGVISIGTYAFSLVLSLCANVRLVCTEICTFLLGALPAVTALYASSVGAATATAGHTAVITSLGLIQSAVTLIVIPGTKVVLLLSCLSAVTRFMDLSGLCTLVKSALMWVLGVIVSLTSAVMFFQTALGASADGFAVRGMRFAAQSAIPIVGGVISESMRVVTESVKLVRSVCGIMGILTLVYSVLTPFALAITYKICFGLCANVAGMLGASRCKSLLASLEGVINIAFACLAATAFIGVIMFAIFLKAA